MKRTDYMLGKTRPVVEITLAAGQVWAPVSRKRFDPITISIRWDQAEWNLADPEKYNREDGTYQWMVQYYYPDIGQSFSRYTLTRVIKDTFRQGYYLTPFRAEDMESENNEEDILRDAWEQEQQDRHETEMMARTR